MSQPKPDPIDKAELQKEIDFILNDDTLTEEERTDQLLRKLEWGETGSPSHLEARYKLNYLLQSATEKAVEERLGFWANDIAQCFKPVCCQCKRLATEQTYKGEQAQKDLNRPVNWGYYCKKHADEGRELEREAMYG